MTTDALAPHMRPENAFQGLILTLQRFWADKGCVVLQPYDMEVGAGTFHPATTLRSLGPKHWKAAYVQPSRRPTDGRYGENPNRLQHYYQFQVILKPNAGLTCRIFTCDQPGGDRHRPRRCTTSALSRTTGKARRSAPGGWAGSAGVTAWKYPSSPISSRWRAFECAPVSGELTYGLERLAMYVQGVENVYDLNFNGRDGADRVTYGDVFLQAEQEYSRHNFEYADTDMLFEPVSHGRRRPARRISPARLGRRVGGGRAGYGAKGEPPPHASLPAYDQCIKASHVFNLLDARGVISVTERQSYILRVRELAKACGAAFLRTEAGGAGAE